MSDDALTNLEQAIAIVPARLGSSRFPGKVLADKTGKTLIQHVYEAAKGARLVEDVVIAADDERVLDIAAAFGARAVLTRADHPNGTSRLAEAAAVLDLADDAIVVNVQGDEPELDPFLIDAAIEALVDSDAPVATVASPFAADEDPANPNIVKVVTTAQGRALYFSRALIPHDRDAVGGVAGAAGAAGAAEPLKHVGLYVYRRSFLEKYMKLEPTPLEQTERLEQLRILEHGYPIAVAIRQVNHHGIDTPEQYAAFVDRYLGQL